MSLKLKYETGVATSVQFVVLTLLNFISGVSGSISECTNGSGNCISNIILSLLYFLLITVWFGGLWLAGFAAQDRRSRRIARLLIAGEGLVALVGLFDLLHHTHSILGILISLVEVVSAVWVAWLAFRLMLAKGGRITSARRIRRRPKPQS